uniref:NAB domain-containing protein n=1 Tax=Vitis vinifera TaxID=29760 RepID=F6GUA8_VITVI
MILLLLLSLFFNRFYHHFSGFLVLHVPSIGFFFFLECFSWKSIIFPRFAIAVCKLNLESKAILVSHFLQRISAPCRYKLRSLDLHFSICYQQKYQSADTLQNKALRVYWIQPSKSTLKLHQLSSMASSLVKSQKNLKRTESKKSHSWWWDSHISPKNSKWLADNLEEMDQSVKRMLKLIEEDGDSFAKKAEMYYQKRPELISHVEDFYRIYRSLAERYDHVTGELRKNILSDLQSQGSGISDLGSEPASTCPSPDQRERRRKSGRRAAGFDFFLGSGGSSSDLYNKGDESSSLSDSESGSDDSSVNNYLGLRAAKEKIQLSEEEIVRLKTELQKYGPLNFTNNFQAELVELPPRDIKMQESELDLVEELRITKERLQGSEKEIATLIDELASRGSSESISHMQEQLELTHKDIAMWKAKLDREKREVSKLQERVGRYKTSLSDREHEIRELKEVISDADHNFELEKSLLMAKISKLLDDQSHLEEKLKEWELRCQSLEEEIKQADTAESGDRINDLNKSLDALNLKHDTLMSERDELSARVERQKGLVSEAAEEKREAIRQLCFSLEHYRNDYNRLRQAFTVHKRPAVLTS